MKRSFWYTLLPILGILTLCCACHDIEEYPADAYGNFDALWETVDKRYCFFPEKDVDWQEIRDRYRNQINPEMTVGEYFGLLSGMLAELKDGHVNLIAPFNTSYYRKWWTDYPQNFNLRTILQYYLDFDYLTTGGIIYKVLPGNIGYMRYASFSSTVSDSNLDYILSCFHDCDALIIDIRDNGGGSLSNIKPFLSRFISEEMTGAYILHKTGPGHTDFSKPYPIKYSPASEGRLRWSKPVALLINRSTFSAANTFAAVMKKLPQVILIGARTGGGGGMPFTYQLPIGWSVRFSASPITDADGRSIEDGIEPSPGMAVSAPESQLAAGTDAILDKAVSTLTAQQHKQLP